MGLVKQIIEVVRLDSNRSASESPWQCKQSIDNSVNKSGLVETNGGVTTTAVFADPFSWSPPTLAPAALTAGEVTLSTRFAILAKSYFVFYLIYYSECCTVPDERGAPVDANVWQRMFRRLDKMKQMTTQAIN